MMKMNSKNKALIIISFIIINTALPFLSVATAEEPIENDLVLEKISTVLEWVEDKTIGFNSSTALQGRLLTSESIPLSNKKLDFYMVTDEGSEVYLGSNITDNFGVAEFTAEDWRYFHDGDHPYRVEFSGDDKYEGVSKSAIVTIKYNLWWSYMNLALSLNGRQHERWLGVIASCSIVAGLFGHKDDLLKLDWSIYYEFDYLLSGGGCVRHRIETLKSGTWTFTIGTKSQNLDLHHNTPIGQYIENLRDGGKKVEGSEIFFGIMRLSYKPAAIRIITAPYKINHIRSINQR